MSNQANAAREMTAAEVAQRELIKTILRPLVEEILTNAFDVYKKVNEYQDDVIMRKIKEFMGPLEERLADRMQQPGMYRKEKDLEFMRQKMEYEMKKQSGIPPIMRGKQKLTDPY